VFFHIGQQRRSIRFNEEGGRLGGSVVSPAATDGRSVSQLGNIPIIVKRLTLRFDTAVGVVTTTAIVGSEIHGSLRRMELKRGVHIGHGRRKRGIRHVAPSAAPRLLSLLLLACCANVVSTWVASIVTTPRSSKVGISLPVVNAVHGRTETLGTKVIAVKSTTVNAPSIIDGIVVVLDAVALSIITNVVDIPGRRKGGHGSVEIGSIVKALRFLRF